MLALNMENVRVTQRNYFGENLAREKVLWSYESPFCIFWVKKPSLWNF